jgi:nucleoside-diphosphate-sugar epimerase
MSHLVIVGAGPVGSGIATALTQRGDEVTVLTRSGSGPKRPGVRLLAVDASDAQAVAFAAEGAATIFNCANPRYHRWACEWPPIHRSLMQAARQTGAVVVMMDNLYAFGPNTTMPMREDSPMCATGTKGAVRASMAKELLQAHADGQLRATLARASDFFGPTVRGASLGERVIPKLIAGKKVSVLGSLDTPHSSSYMPDVVRTMITIAGDERAWGKPWQVPNAPATTQRQTLQALATAAGQPLKVATIPYVALQALGLFVPLMRELKETWYQFSDPFVTDSTLTEQTFGLTATPLAEAAEETIAWWRASSSDSGARASLTPT